MCTALSGSLCCCRWSSGVRRAVGRSAALLSFGGGLGLLEKLLSPSKLLEILIEDFLSRLSAEDVLTKKPIVRSKHFTYRRFSSGSHVISCLASYPSHFTWNFKVPCDHD